MVEETESGKEIETIETGFVYTGPWQIVRPHYFDLRINNFRTVRPDDETIRARQATLRIYPIGGVATTGEIDKQQVAGYLISWNERTKRVLVSDDIYPIPVDNVRIGTRTSIEVSDPADSAKKTLKRVEQEAVIANILVFIRARVVNPYLFLYRAEDTMETIQNELIQHIRELCAGWSLEQVYALRATLESDQADQENLILKQNGFGRYMETRYGFKIKGASFAYIIVVGKAADALTAPFVARQEAQATIAQGEGEGKAEKLRLTLEAEGFQAAESLTSKETATLLRRSDVASQLATSGKASTVVLGLDSLIEPLKQIAGVAIAPSPTLTPTLTPTKGGKDDEPEPKQPAAPPQQ